jgi:hypothetical protein
MTKRKNLKTQSSLYSLCVAPFSPTSLQLVSGIQVRCTKTRLLVHMTTYRKPARYLHVQMLQAGQNSGISLSTGEKPEFYRRNA